MDYPEHLEQLDLRDLRYFRAERIKYHTLRPIAAMTNTICIASSTRLENKFKKGLVA
jgi:hypothetical protein